MQSLKLATACVGVRPIFCRVTGLGPIRSDAGSRRACGREPSEQRRGDQQRLGAEFLEVFQSAASNPKLQPGTKLQAVGRHQVTRWRSGARRFLSSEKVEREGGGVLYQLSRSGISTGQQSLATGRFRVMRHDFWRRRTKHHPARSGRHCRSLEVAMATNGLLCGPQNRLNELVTCVLGDGFGSFYF